MMIDNLAISQNWKRNPTSQIVQIARRNVLHDLLSLDLGSLSLVYKGNGTTCELYLLASHTQAPSRFPSLSIPSYLYSMTQKKTRSFLSLGGTKRAFRLVILKVRKFAFSNLLLAT
jgi:hypothetical protein